MIVYNITFHIDDSVLENYLSFLKDEYIPRATLSGSFFNPRLCKILSSSGDGSSSYSLQFNVENHDILNHWRENEEILLHNQIVNRFADKVLGFVTLLEELKSI